MPPDPRAGLQLLTMPPSLKFLPTSLYSTQKATIISAVFSHTKVVVLTSPGLIGFKESFSKKFVLQNFVNVLYFEEILLEICFIEEMKTTWGNKEVP